MFSRHNQMRPARALWLILVSAFLFTVSSFAQQPSSQVPDGVKIKPAPDADIAASKEVLERALANEAFPKDALSGIATCGPTLWAKLKKSADQKLLQSKVVTMMMSSPEPFQTVARGLITEEQRQSFWVQLRAKYPALKNAKIRKANADELRYFWATIPFESIEEPFFAIEAGQQTFIANLKIDNKSPRLIWIDMVGDMSSLPNEDLTPDEVKEFGAVAELGIPISMYQLGKTYLLGKGVPVDLEKARIWLDKASEKGVLEAQMLLGSAYMSGTKYPIDHQLAAKYLLQAAEQQNINGGLRSEQALAQYWVAMMYEQGRGVSKSHENAIKYLQLAAENGNYSAQYDLGSLYEAGAGGLAMDKPKACGLFVKAAEQGHRKALHNAGYCYHSGVGVSQDARMAILYYTKAAEQGDVRSEYNMGVLYGQIGRAEESYFWLRVAELSGVEHAKPLAEKAKPNLSAEQVSIQENKIAVWLEAHKPRKH